MGAKGGTDIDRPDRLKALARRCRELAASTDDVNARHSLELLAQDYDKQAAQSEPEPAVPPIPTPPIEN